MGRGSFHCFDVIIYVEAETRPAGIISILTNQEAGILKGCVTWLMLRRMTVGQTRVDFQSVPLQILI